jgi:hypothetical protein
MKKTNAFAIAFLGLSVASLTLPFGAAEAQAYGKKIYSSRPLSGYVCNRERGEVRYTCYSVPSGNRGVNFTVGDRKYSF